jgi:hypothetical protein
MTHHTALVLLICLDWGMYHSKSSMPHNNYFLNKKKKKKRRRPVEIHSLHLLCHSPPDKEGGDWGGFNPAHLCGPEWKSTHIEGEGGDRHIHIEVV